ncbi:alcohol dehydrogenase catalytic domain-containing protein [Nonomuraea maheshkhaliensis]
MKAAVYEGPRQVRVREVPDARIERPTDVLVRITSANVCGSGLHMHEGRTDFEPGRGFGRENLGQVVEVGAGADKVQVGDWVALLAGVQPGDQTVTYAAGPVVLMAARSATIRGASKVMVADRRPHRRGLHCQRRDPGARPRPRRRRHLHGGPAGRRGVGRRLRRAAPAGRDGEPVPSDSRA